MLETQLISKALRLVSSQANRYTPRKQVFRLHFLDFQGYCPVLEDYRHLKLCECCVDPQTDYYQQEFDSGRLEISGGVGITYQEEILLAQDRIIHCSHCYHTIKTHWDFSREVLLLWAEGLSDWEFRQALIYPANNYELFEILRNKHAASKLPNELNKIAQRIIQTVNPNLIWLFLTKFFALDFSGIYELSNPQTN